MEDKKDKHLADDYSVKTVVSALGLTYSSSSEELFSIACLSSQLRSP